jgi:hypothetical protein
MANKYAITPAVVQLASGASVFVDAGSLWPSAGAVVTAAPALFATAMTLAATTVASVNPNPVPQSVTITGGTVTVIAVNGAVTGLTTGTFTVPAGGSITVTYSAAPTFAVADVPPAAGTYPFVNSTLAGYLAVYPNGPQVS